MSVDGWDDDCSAPTSATTAVVIADDYLNGSNNNQETKKFRVDPSKTESVVFQIAAKDIGRLIGRGGETIKKLRQNTSCQVPNCTKKILLLLSVSSSQTVSKL